MAGVNQARRLAAKRLMKDLEEIRNSPVPNISAIPLDDDFFEWHCCVSVEDTMFHIILYFPENYPQSAPSADFFPVGIGLNRFANRRGLKGTKFCLSVLSDYDDLHSEWKSDIGYGWSPAYTVQTLLVNISAFLSEYNVAVHNSTLLKDPLQKCDDCGYTCENPFPPLPEAHRPVIASLTQNQPTISCYITRQTFNGRETPQSDEELFGMGVEYRFDDRRPFLASPCETLSHGGFQSMKESSGVVKTTQKEEIDSFLPLFLHPNHGDKIKDLFETCLSELVKVVCNHKSRKLSKTPSIAENILNVIPNLMATTVEDFSKALEGSADQLNGFFFFHRLLVWAAETYPDVQTLANQRIEKFIEEDRNRKKEACPYIDELLMLLTLSGKYRWEDVAEIYIFETWNREIMGLLKDRYDIVDPDNDSSVVISMLSPFHDLNKRMALQMAFLNTACPYGYSRQDVIRRYDNNLGFPTSEMENEVRSQLQKTRETKVFADWFEIWNLGPVTEDVIRKLLVKSVQFCFENTGYCRGLTHRSFWKRCLTKWKKAHSSEQLQKLKPLRLPILKTPTAQTLFPKPSTSGADDGHRPVLCNADSRAMSSGTDIDEKQGTQPMDLSNHTIDNHTIVDTTDRVTPRPSLKSSMTINCLAAIRDKRYCEIFGDSTGFVKPKRALSCRI